MLTFEIPAVKCHNGVEVNWSRYRDTGVTDPALHMTLLSWCMEVCPQDLSPHKAMPTQTYCSRSTYRRDLTWRVLLLFIQHFLAENTQYERAKSTIITKGRQ